MPEDIEGKVIGPAIYAKHKINIDASSNVMPISTFRKLCPAMFDSSGKPLEKLSADWTTLTAYGGGIIKQLEVRVIKYIWNNEKWKLPFHIVDTTVPILLGLKLWRHMGLLKKHPRVFTETMDNHSTNPGLANQQLGGGGWSKQK